MRYVQPQSLSEALQWGQTPGAAYLAGGTDLILKMRTGEVRPDLLVDLAQVKELKEIKLEEESLMLGSMVTFSEIEQSSLLQENARGLWQACLTMGAPQIRNQATLGGNLGNCSPAADSLPPLLALDTQVVLCSLKAESNSLVQEERVSLTEILERQPLLERGTLIRGYRIPCRGYVSAFAKLGRRQALAIARMSVAVALYKEGSLVRDVRVAFGAVGRRAFLSEDLNNALKGRPMDETWIELAIEKAQNVVGKALGDRASAAYKRVAVAGVMRETLANLIERRE